MTRTTALLLALAAAAPAEPPAAGKVVLVDGREIPGARLLDGTATRVRLQRADKTTFEVPATHLVSVAEPKPVPHRSPHPFNLYLRNGDRLRGEVKGAGETLLLDSPGVKKLRVDLADVTAVRFGRLLVTLEAKYGEVFADERQRGRDVVVVQRDTRPFPVYARVLSLQEDALRVRIDDQMRDLPYHKVYGFVRAQDDDAAEAEGLRVRVSLSGGGRVTLPLDRITDTVISSGETRVLRAHVDRLEFSGDHIAHLSDFDPIGVKEVALFGEAPKWRRDGMVLGGPLRMHGRLYVHGVGVSAYSRLEYALASRWSRFFVRCGIDDAAGSEGDAIFRVHGDGRLLKEVRRRHGEEPGAVHLDVKGVDRLVLEAVPGTSYISDFCDWADARVFNAQPGEDGK
ncbi:MAG: NPCBM/NEW2 domain-containing protein [Planctomycetota bacterium]